MVSQPISSSATEPRCDALPRWPTCSVLTGEGLLSLEMALTRKSGSLPFLSKSQRSPWPLSWRQARLREGNCTTGRFSYSSQVEGQSLAFS